MNKITERDIRVFVAGAFAFYGFEALVWLPSFFGLPAQGLVWASLIASSLVRALSLPIGLAILLGNQRAILLAKIYIWLEILLDLTIAVTTTCLQNFPAPAQKMPFPVGQFISDLLVSIVLLWLLSTRRFHPAPDSLQTPAATAP